MALKKYIVDLLQDNPLNGISTYIDVLTLSTGAINRKIQKWVLTGEEDWRELSADTTKHYLTTITPDYLRADSQVTYISSHYAAYEQTTSATLVPNGRFSMASNTTAQRLYIADATYTTNDTWKAYLAQQYANGTPVTVWYVLATPTTEQITVPTGLSGTVDGYTTQTGTPTPTNPIYPTANTVTMWANYTPSRYNGIAFVTATGQPEQYNGGWT